MSFEIAWAGVGAVRVQGQGLGRVRVQGQGLGRVRVQGQGLGRVRVQGQGQGQQIGHWTQFGASSLGHPGVVAYAGADCARIFQFQSNSFVLHSL